MHKSILLFITGIVFLLMNESRVLATHNRAGEITLSRISDLTYEITITTFTYSLSPASNSRNYLTVDWGDNSSSQADRISILMLENYYQRNVYVSTHTFPGPGTYSIVVEDPNRNYGVVNIPNSVNVIFSVKTIITISPELGDNSTPVLLNYPIDRAALNQTFIHNPAAFDYEGDSLSYSLTVCTKENGEEIEDYEFPAASDTLYVDPITGDLVWDAPMETGIYNIAMNIEEWREGVKIGNIARDMQIDVYETLNRPPVTDSIPNICVPAGTVVQIPIRSTDPDGDNITHLVTGGPFVFEDSSAIFEVISSEPGTINSLFTWNTSCLHPRSQPYTVLVKAEDDNSEITLVDIDNFSIKVLGPPPATPELIPSSLSINVLWDKYECSEIKGYNIYRSTESIDYVYDACTPGLPAYTGYTLIGTTNAHSDTSFLDNNNGDGLLQGVEYCYRITAILSDETESFPSDENCTNLISGSPSLLQVSVNDYDENGEILVSWAKPGQLDTIPANGPYEYIIYRSSDLWGNSLSEIASFETTDLNDTSFLDNGINTTIFPWTYSVELYNNEAGNRFLIGKPETASSVYPEISEHDNKLELNFRRNVPWLNDSYTVFRSTDLGLSFDSLTTTSEDSFIDDNLKNNKTYCYYVVSSGKRDLNDREYPNMNISHRNCGTPIDSIAPCPPLLEAMSDCDSLYNLLNWYYTDGLALCSEDVVRYKLYYRPDLSMEYTVIDSIEGRENTSYRHYPEGGLAAEYYVTAVDSFANESIASVKVIVDNCIKYAIPNVFSPNNDGFNDVLQPYEYQDVEKIDLKIFNRWGQQIFETENPDILWNGKHQDTNELVSPGVYYYICDVYENRISGTEVRNIVGFIHIYHEKGATNADEVEF